MSLTGLAVMAAAEAHGPDEMSPVAEAAHERSPLLPRDPRAASARRARPFYPGLIAAFLDLLVHVTVYFGFLILAATRAHHGDVDHGHGDDDHDLDSDRGWHDRGLSLVALASVRAVVWIALCSALQPSYRIGRWSLPLRPLVVSLSMSSTKLTLLRMAIPFDAESRIVLLVLGFCSFLFPWLECATVVFWPLPPAVAAAVDVDAGAPVAVVPAVADMEAGADPDRWAHVAPAPSGDAFTGRALTASRAPAAGPDDAHGTNALRLAPPASTSPAASPSSAAPSAHQDMLHPRLDHLKMGSPMAASLPIQVKMHPSAGGGDGGSGSFRSHTGHGQGSLSGSQQRLGMPHAPHPPLYGNDDGDGDGATVAQDVPEAMRTSLSGHPFHRANPRHQPQPPPSLTAEHFSLHDPRGMFPASPAGATKYRRPYNMAAIANAHSASLPAHHAATALRAHAPQRREHGITGTYLAPSALNPMRASMRNSLAASSSSLHSGDSDRGDADAEVESDGMAIAPQGGIPGRAPSSLLMGGSAASLGGASDGPTDVGVDLDLIEAALSPAGFELGRPRVALPWQITHFRGTADLDATRAMLRHGSLPAPAPAPGSATQMTPEAQADAILAEARGAWLAYLAGGGQESALLTLDALYKRHDALFRRLGSASAHLADGSLSGSVTASWLSPASSTSLSSSPAAAGALRPRSALAPLLLSTSQEQDGVHGAPAMALTPPITASLDHEGRQLQCAEWLLIQGAWAIWRGKEIQGAFLLRRAVKSYTKTQATLLRLARRPPGRGPAAAAAVAAAAAAGVDPPTFERPPALDRCCEQLNAGLGILHLLGQMQWTGSPSFAHLMQAFDAMQFVPDPEMGMARLLAVLAYNGAYAPLAAVALLTAVWRRGEGALRWVQDAAAARAGSLAADTVDDLDASGIHDAFDGGSDMDGPTPPTSPPTSPPPLVATWLQTWSATVSDAAVAPALESAMALLFGPPAPAAAAPWSPLDGSPPPPRAAAPASPNASAATAALPPLFRLVCALADPTAATVLSAATAPTDAHPAFLALWRAWLGPWPLPATLSSALPASWRGLLVSAVTGDVPDAVRRAWQQYLLYPATVRVPSVAPSDVPASAAWVLAVLRHAQANRETARRERDRAGMSVADAAAAVVVPEEARNGTHPGSAFFWVEIALSERRDGHTARSTELIEYLEADADAASGVTAPPAWSPSRDVHVPLPVLSEEVRALAVAWIARLRQASLI